MGVDGAVIAAPRPVRLSGRESLTRYPTRRTTGGGDGDGGRPQSLAPAPTVAGRSLAETSVVTTKPEPEVVGSDLPAAFYTGPRFP